MTTMTQEAERPQLKDLGWQLRGELGAHYHERPGYFFEDGRPVRTETFPTPKGAVESARKLQDAIDDGQIVVEKREESGDDMPEEFTNLRDIIERGKAEAQATDAQAPPEPEEELSPLCSRVLARLEAVETLPDFHLTTSDEYLEELVAGRDDERFSSRECEIIRAAIDTCATRLGASKAAPGAGLFGDPTPPASEGGQHLLSLTQQMLPSKMTRHPSLLMRAGGLNGAHVKELREHLEAGGRFKDEVVLFFDEEAGGVHWVAEGNHRHEAALPTDTPLDVEIRTGSLRDAVIYAAGANAQHGLKRSNDDKRLAVLALLSDPEVFGLSDTRVAEIARVTQPFVGAVRRDLSAIFVSGGGLPPFDDNEDEDEYSERVSAQTGAGAGLVRVLVNMPDDEQAGLTLNVLGDTGLRESKDGRLVDTAAAAATRAAREAAEELQPALLPSDDAQGEAEQAPAAEAAPTPGEAVDAPHAGVAEPAAPAEAPQPSITVNDRRHTAGEAAPTQHQPAPHHPPAERAPAEKRPERPPVESLLKGRSLVITYTYLPVMAGKVNVTVRVCDDITKTPGPGESVFGVLDSAQVRHTSDRVHEMIAGQIKAAGKAPAKKGAKTPPAGSKAGAASRKSAAKKKPAAAAKKPAAKKSTKKSGSRK